LKNRYFFRTFILASLIACFLGCAAKEPLTNFYVLGRPKRTHSAHGGGMAVYVNRVEVPAYLAQTGLVTMTGGIEVRYSVSARWAEPLDRGISRAVADALSQTSGLRAYSFSPGAPPPPHAYDIRIRIERFEGNDNGEVSLQARWEVTTTDSSQIVASRKVNLRRSDWQPGDYAGLVRLLSAEINEMSRQIGRSIAGGA
jgi:uncharacterized lipoprotein YmbA